MRLIDADKIPYVEAVKETLEPSGEFYARREDICAMPTIEERKKGEWIIEDTLNMKVSCGSCGFVLEDWIQGALYRYCPNCGADMRGEQDE